MFIFYISLLSTYYEPIRQDVECGLRRGFPSALGGRRGWIPCLGYSGKEGVTFLFVHIMEWQSQWRLEWGWVVEGPLGSVAPIITFTAAGAGLCGRTRAGKTSPMMYTPQARRTRRQ